MGRTGPECPPPVDADMCATLRLQTVFFPSPFCAFRDRIERRVCFSAQAIFGEKEVLSLSWQHRDVREFHKRWWQLRDTALEIFLLNGKTYLLAFENIAVSRARTL